ncbi:MAG: D-alanyl-D-alanine carboxypeptidase, partial [Clostridia bacterium]|nr:D-alanyl-D-alanine carboxypeptidase [Clostridia bacterium]
NHNKLLRMYDGAIGVKTGYTKRSGRCLVSAAERDGLTLIAVTLCAPDDWNDHEQMLDAGFAALERVTLCARGEFETLVPVTGGREGYVMVQNAEEASLTMPRNRAGMLCTVELPRFLYADVADSAVIGCLIFRCDTDGDGTPEEIARVPLETVYGVERRPHKSLWQRLWDRLTGRSD